MLKTIKKVLPGKPGTIKLLAKYGKEFVCLRYRHDLKNNKRIKTVELIIEETDLLPDHTI